MESIRTWLNGPRNYEQGVLLYNQFGTSDAMKQVFGFGNTSYNRTKLAELLEALLPAPVPETPAIADTPTFQPKTDTVSPAPVKRPEPETPLSEQWKPLYKDAAFLHGQLTTATTTEARKEMAFSILDKFDEMEALWDQEDHFREHGSLTPSGTTPDINAMTLVQKTDRLKNICTYISKHKNNPKRAADVAAWEAEKKLLKEVLEHERSN